MARLALAAVLYLAALGWCSLGDSADEECAASPLSGGEGVQEADFDTSYLQLSRSRLGSGAYKGKANAEALSQMFEIVKSEVGTKSYADLSPDVQALIESLLQIIEKEILVAIIDDHNAAQERLKAFLDDLVEASKTCSSAKEGADKVCGNSYDHESEYKTSQEDAYACAGRNREYKAQAADYCGKSAQDSRYEWSLDANMTAGECDNSKFCNGRGGITMGSGDSEGYAYNHGQACDLDRTKNWCDAQKQLELYQQSIANAIEGTHAKYQENCQKCDNAKTSVANETKYCTDLAADAYKKGMKSDETLQEQLISVCGFGVKYQSKCAALFRFNEIVEQTQLDSSYHDWSEPERKREWYAVNTIKCVMTGFKNGKPIDGGNYSDKTLFDECQDELKPDANYSKAVGVMDYFEDEVATITYDFDCTEVEIQFGHFKFQGAYPKVNRDIKSPPFLFCGSRVLPGSIAHCPAVEPGSRGADLDCSDFEEGHTCEYHETCCPGSTTLEESYLSATAVCKDGRWNVQKATSVPTACSDPKCLPSYDAGCCFSMEFTEHHHQPCCLNAQRYEETQSECLASQGEYPNGEILGWAHVCPTDQYQAAKWLGLHLPSNTCPKNHDQVRDGGVCSDDQAGQTCTYEQVCCLGTEHEVKVPFKEARCESGYLQWAVTEFSPECHCEYGGGGYKPKVDGYSKNYYAPLVPYKEYGCPNYEEADGMEGQECFQGGKVCSYKKVCCSGTYKQAYNNDYRLMCKRVTGYHDKEQKNAWVKFDDSEDCPATCPNPNDSSCPSKDDVVAQRVKAGDRCEGSAECWYQRGCCNGGVEEQALRLSCDGEKWTFGAGQDLNSLNTDHCAITDAECKKTYPAFFMAQAANEEIQNPDAKCPMLMDGESEIQARDLDQASRCGLYKEIVRDVMLQVSNVDGADDCHSTFDGTKTHKVPKCHTADWIGCIARFAGHDFMDRVQASNEGGADACLKMNDPDNKGVEACMWEGELSQKLSSTWAKYCRRLSLADFTVIAAEAVMTWARQNLEFHEKANPGQDPNDQSTKNFLNNFIRDALAETGSDRFLKMNGIDFINNFRFGRETSAECPNAPALPHANEGCDEVQRVFVTGMGLDWRESAAMMGVHTLGQAHPDNSGIEGPWAKVEHSNMLDNSYYKTMVFDGWVQHTDPDSGKSWWISGSMKESETDGQLMLDTDLCFFYDVNSKRITSDDSSKGCCAWSFSEQRITNPSDLSSQPLSSFGNARGMCATAEVTTEWWNLSGDNNKLSAQHGMCCKAGGSSTPTPGNGPGDEKDNCPGVPPQNTRGKAQHAVATFANSESEWLTAFRDAWGKATTAGHAQLSDAGGCLN